MNRIYRIVWSEALRTCVVASEFAKRRGKGTGSRSKVVGGAPSCAGRSGGASGRSLGLIGLTGNTAVAARFTGAGGLDVTGNTVRLTNDANDYTGQTRFRGNGSRYFISIADLGIASSLGAPIDPALGTIGFNTANNYTDRLYYLGDGDSSNRNWQIGTTSNGSGAAQLLTGTGGGTDRPWTVNNGTIRKRW